MFGTHGFASDQVNGRPPHPNPFVLLRALRGEDSLLVTI
jgi:hypothetical protein